MDSAGHSTAGTTQNQSAVQRLLGPRPAFMAFAAVCVLAAVVALAQLVLSSQHASQRSAEQRFANGAVIRGQLTSALLTTSSVALRATGAATPATPAALDRFVKASKLGYAAILSDGGDVLAVSSGTPPATARRLASHPAYVRQALTGRTWLSDVQRGTAGDAPTLDWAVPFRSASGRRVLVEGVPTATLSPFLSAFLNQGSSGRSLYVVDSERRLIAASKSAGLEGGSRLPAALQRAGDITSRTIAGRFTAAAGIGGTGWQLVLTQPSSALYPGLTGSRGWLLWAIVVLVAIVGFASLIPLRRSQLRAAQLVAAHAELRALNASLEAQVADRTELAERRAHALGRSNAELEQFASVAAHDLQEPLRKIRMYCERLQRRRDEIPAEVEEDVVRMEAAAGRMQNLISDLLDLARVNSRGRELVAVDLGDVVRDVAVDLEARIADAGANVEVGALPTVLGDPVQLRQIMQNLLSNALKFHRKDVPLHVSVETETSASGRCVIAVRDNGIGFDEKYAERIFGTFQRLHGRSQYEGTGIGLSIARKIAWRHDGDITASAVEGEGATFRLTLPLAQAPARTAPATAPTPATQPQTERTAA